VTTEDTSDSERPRWGVIGGTGLESLEGFVATSQTVATTPYGDSSGPVIRGTLAGTPIAFLSRHGADHRLAPHQINYRANVWALSQCCERVVAVAAVGAIESSYAPGDLVIVDQIVDYTWGREHTYSGTVTDPGGDVIGSVLHIDFTHPYDESVRRALIEAAARARVPIHDGGVYAATQGPRLESAAEINRLERDGCSVVGMTGMPEAALARELSLPYASCAVVVNPAAGRGPGDITMDMIRGHLSTGMQRVYALLHELA
jgi:5'-methylthioinosine phosphorylase